MALAYFALGDDPEGDARGYPSSSDPAQVDLPADAVAG